ncbi:MAG: DUF1800 domain-containing protein [Planctomycetes bacterium]|nr:DUF1800 domain-containing protein [Planctomycetota bacterium]
MNRARAIEDPLAPFEPSPTEPWDAARAAHLARRAGFGTRPDEVRELVALGPRAAVDRLVDFADEDRELDAELAAKGGSLAELDNQNRIGERLGENTRAWWLYRMVRGRAPLQEKLCLFWHAHFACRESELLPPPLLLAQNRTFRRLAAARFGDVLAAVARDPAMLVFLDNRSNEKTRPNENWARELLELFTLGVGAYEQHDVVEVARVFTGWRLSPDGSAFAFAPEHHDDGDKRVLGERIAGRGGPEGEREGVELLARLARDPRTAERLAGKLARWFLADEPEPACVAALATELVARDFSVRETLRTLLCSRAFHAPDSRFALARTPVDLVVAAARTLEVQNAHLLGLERTTARMGMQLLRPPNVAGWKLGKHWIHPSAAAHRASFARELAALPHTTRSVDGRAALDLERLAAGLTEPRALARSLGERLFGVEPATDALDDFVSTLAPGASPHDVVRAALERWVGAADFALA